MKKIKSRFQTRFHIFKDTSFLQRMLLIYIVGGIIPLLGASMYTNFQTRKMMIDLSKETQMEEISLLGSSIGESVTVLENVARLLCLNEEVQKMATKKYSGSTQFFKDYYSTSAITEYLNYYQQDISYINVYLNNPSIDRNYIQKAKNVSYLSDDVKKREWYKKTVSLVDAPYWYYGKESLADPRKSIQVSQAMRDGSGEVIAVVRILMQFRKTVDAINERNVDTMLLYNDRSVVNANYDADHKYSFLRENSDDDQWASVSQRVLQGKDEYLVTCKKLSPIGSADCYSLVSIQKYQDILSNVNRISMRAFLPEVVGIIVSMILILVFTISHGRRINQLRLQMAHVAQGEYDLVEPVEGNDEIGKIYQELEQMTGDIQKLMADVIREQVQKEKLHTRQKEVEFKMLASQINPHFLYNTLETIRMKAMVNKQTEIAELVMMLAKTMRYNIQVTDQLVTLRAEIQMVKYYLKIQEYRFGDRISSQVIIEPDVDMSALILPLIIQPLVENAFVHGLEERDSGGVLEIRIRMEGEDIEIFVQDNGVGMDYYQLKKLRQSLRGDNGDRTHIGVRNVDQRIKILYGKQYGVQIQSRKKAGTRVILHIPFRLNEDENL